MRLIDLEGADIMDWIDARDQFGREKYGDSHMRRYNLVDIMEELIDAHVILHRFAERMNEDQDERLDGMDIFGLVPHVIDSFRAIDLTLEIQEDLLKLMHKLQRLDGLVPADVSQDTEPVLRIWWNKQRIEPKYRREDVTDELVRQRLGEALATQLPDEIVEQLAEILEMKYGDESICDVCEDICTCDEEEEDD